MTWVWIVMSLMNSSPGHVFISFPASRYRSALIGICVHSVQTVVFNRAATHAGAPMNLMLTTRSFTRAGSRVDPDRFWFPRPLMIFLAVALGVGWPLLTLSTPSSRTGRRPRAVRDCVRLPRRWWWLLLAAFGLPAVETWPIGAALDARR